MDSENWARTSLKRSLSDYLIILQDYSVANIRQTSAENRSIFHALNPEFTIAFYIHCRARILMLQLF